MDDLRRLYREALVARIDALQVARQAFLAGDQEGVDSIRRLAHTLKGSGGTYGFPEITEAAEALEAGEADQAIPLLDTLLGILREVASSGDERKFGLLIIEDDPVTSRILQSRLAGANREIFAVETAAAAEKVLEGEDIAIILLDLILPDTDGRNFLVNIRERPELAGLPVIITSVKGSASTKAECFALGADEYFEKPIDYEVLSAAVAAKLQRSGELVRESRTDPLTGLPNRAAFHEAFKRAQSLASRSRESLSLAILDLDHFKSVNDTYGHGLGDEVLRRLGPVITGALRQTDFLARWGGEEFVILFPKAGVAGSTRALQKALDAFGQEEFRGAEGVSFQVTFSAGVTAVWDKVNVGEAVAMADRLLYRAKSGGRNRILNEAVSAPLEKKNILLAEDDEVTAAVIKHRLSREGFEVIHFSDGAAALKGASDLEVSLAILDVKMPGIDGFELLERLRQIPPYRKIPIVMLTSMGSEKDIVRGFESGADDYIMKPFSPVELLARIRRLIRAR